MTTPPQPQPAPRATEPQNAAKTAGPAASPQQQAGQPPTATDPTLAAERGPAAGGLDDAERSRLAELERELGELRDKQAASQGAGEPLAMKVEEPHSDFHFGGLHLTTEYKPVPAHMAAAVSTAAAEAGVTLTTKED